MQHSTNHADLTWLVDEFVERVVGIDHAVVLSADGLLMERSRRLSHEDAEHLSAVASAFQSLSRGAVHYFQGGGVRQTLLEMDNGLLFVMAAGQGACLAVLAANDADLGLVAYEMNRLVKRVKSALSAAPRSTVEPNGGHSNKAR